MLYRFVMVLDRLLFAVLRTHRVVTGAENIPSDGGAVIAGTHFGYLEFALVAWVVWRHDRRKLRFMITSSAFRNPLLGSVLRRLGQIPVDRKAGAASFDVAVDALRGGSIIFIFPEAGIDPSFTVRPLKTGAVRLASDAGVPLIPVGIWGGQRLLTREHKVGFLERFGIPVRILIGAPVPHDGERHEATDALRASLQELVATLQAGYPDDGTGMWWQPAALGGTAPTPEEAAVLDAAVVARREAKRAR
jgi:1-acyl-sn-glycerol-3-phosphate acyltransferase